MGMLDGLVSGALGHLGASAGQQNPLMQAALQLIQGQEGGLAGLVQKFQGAGLAQQAASWIGTGANMPVSGGLANLLPQVVDKLTPNGAIEQGSLQQGLSALLSSLGK